MDKLHSLLLENYQNNLQYLKQNEIDIYNRIIKLSNDIDKGTYTPIYELELVQDQYFDIKDIKTNSFLYNYDSFAYGNILVNKIDINDENYIKFIRYDNDNNFLPHTLYKGVKPFVEYLNNSFNIKQNYKSIPKMIFFGTGIGKHIVDTIVTKDIKVSLIIEPSMEKFRLSLFTTDYSTINNKLFFSVGQDNVHMLNDFIRFFNYKYEYNYCIIPTLLFDSYEKEYHSILKHIAAYSITSYPYWIMIQGLHRTQEFMSKQYKFIKQDKITNYKPLKDKNILIVGRGPSVYKKIEWIKENQDSFIVIATNSILDYLLENNIKVDICTGTDIAKEKYTDKHLADTKLLALSQVDSQMIKCFNKDNIYFVQALKILSFLDSIPISNNVGGQSFIYSVLLGASKIYLIGTDSAYDINSSEVQEYLKLKNKSHSDIIEEKDINGNIVYTNAVMKLYQTSYETFATLFRDRGYCFDVYNLSDGLPVHSFISKSTTEIELQKTNKNINLDFISTTITSALELKTGLYKKIYNKINILKTKEYKIKEEFLKAKDNFKSFILNNLSNKYNNVYIEIYQHFSNLLDIHLHAMLDKNTDYLFANKELDELAYNYFTTIDEFFIQLENKK
jgi:hypothetical protein